MDRVVLTGIGIVSGLGIGKSTFWSNLLDGHSGLTVSHRWKEGEVGIQLIGAVPEFSHKDYLSDLRPPFPSRYSQMVMIASDLAIKDAGIDMDSQDPLRIGAILNTDFGPNEIVERYLRDLFTKGPEKVSPILFSRTVANVALGEVCRYFRLKGASSMLIGESSICYAFDLLQENRADIILCGGVDELREPIVWAYQQMGLLSSATSEVESDSQPYSGISTGMILGEGAAVVILERLSNAINRKAHIYAEMLSYSTVCDQQGNYVLCERTTEDLIYVMKEATHHARLTPDKFGFVEGCASSHPRLGHTELKAIESIWPEGSIGITNIKGRVGETFGASSALGVCAAALSLAHRIIPNCRQIPAVMSSFIETGTERSLLSSSAACLCNSVHLGGNNTSIVFRAFAKSG